MIEWMGRWTETTLFAVVMIVLLAAVGVLVVVAAREAVAPEPKPEVVHVPVNGRTVTCLIFRGDVVWCDR